MNLQDTVAVIFTVTIVLSFGYIIGLVIYNNSIRTKSKGPQFTARLLKIGNSKAIVLPDEGLVKCGITDSVQLEVKNKVIEIKAIK